MYTTDKIYTCKKADRVFKHTILMERKEKNINTKIIQVRDTMKATYAESKRTLILFLKTFIDGQLFNVLGNEFQSLGPWNNTVI